MDALISSLSSVSAQLLPIVGVVALVFLCILLRKLWNLIDEATKTVHNLEPTLKGIEMSIDKVQGPLDSAVKLTKSIDELSTKTSSGLNHASEIAGENVNKAKVIFQEQLEKAKAILAKATSSQKQDPFERKDRDYSEELKEYEKEKVDHE
ncbi:MAG: hypothetical protein J6D29_08240 [Solobacterium sp.]|nr:hypothetical protein [Solobacterium sp.]